MQIVEAIFGPGRMPEGPVGRAARSGPESEFTAVFDAAMAEAAAPTEAEVKDLAATPQALSGAESDIRFAEARSLPVVSEMAVPSAVYLPVERAVSDMPVKSAPSGDLLPTQSGSLRAPRDLSSTPGVPEMPEPVAAADVDRVVAVRPDLPHDARPAVVVPVDADPRKAAAVAGTPEALTEVAVPARPETGAPDREPPDQARSAAGDLPPKSTWPDMRLEPPQGPDLALPPGNPVAVGAQAMRPDSGAGLASNEPVPDAAMGRGPAVWAGDQWYLAPRPGATVPSTPAAAASPAALFAASTFAQDAAAPVAPSAPSPIAENAGTPMVPAAAGPAAASATQGAPQLAATPLPLSGAVPLAEASAPAPEAPVVRPDAPARILPDPRRAFAPEPAAVASALGSPGVTERFLNPAEVAAPASATGRTGGAELPEPARADTGAQAAGLPARPTEAAPVALQLPDIAIHVDAPEISAPRAAETSGVPGTSAPIAAPDADVRRAVVEQLIATVRATNAGAVEIMLSPEELGQVRLEMKMVDGVMTVRIDAERPETLDLMRRGSDVLFRELRDAGFGALNLSFGSGTSQRGAFASSGDAAGRPDRDMHLDVQAAAPSGPARGLGPARLDIRI